MSNSSALVRSKTQMTIELDGSQPRVEVEETQVLEEIKNEPPAPDNSRANPRATGTPEPDQDDVMSHQNAKKRPCLAHSDSDIVAGTQPPSHPVSSPPPGLSEDAGEFRLSYVYLFRGMAFHPDMAGTVEKSVMNVWGKDCPLSGGSAGDGPRPKAQG